MTVNPIDPVSSLVARMEADATLAALVTGGADVAVAFAAKVRIYGSHIPPRPIMLQSIPDAIAPALVFQSASGPADRYIDAMTYPRIEVRAYGPNDTANAVLWYAALAAIRRMAGMSGSLWLEAGLNVSLPVPRREQSGLRYHSGLVPFTAITH